MCWLSKRFRPKKKRGQNPRRRGWTMGTSKTRHHLWFPAKNYKSKLERKFRALPCNIVLLDLDVHLLLHKHQTPPTKPSAEEMTEVIKKHIGERGA